MNTPEGGTVGFYLELGTLLEGLPADTRVVNTERLLSDEDFRAQDDRNTELGSIARVVSLLIDSDDNVVIVERKAGEHLGLALPSGTVEHGESLRHAVWRETNEEAGIDLAETAFHALVVEIRHHIRRSAPEQRHRTVVARFAARIAADQEIVTTPEAELEGIHAIKQPRKNLPPFVFPGDQDHVDQGAKRLGYTLAA